MRLILLYKDKSYYNIKGMNLKRLSDIIYRFVQRGRIDSCDPGIQLIYTLNDHLIGRDDEDSFDNQLLDMIELLKK